VRLSAGQCLSSLITSDDCPSLSADGTMFGSQ